MRVAEARGVLEVGAHASQDEIRKAYRRAALRWHPDKNPGNTEAATMRFRQVHAAYLALQERAPDEATYTHGNARKEARKDNDVQNERQEQQMPTFEDSLRAFHSVFGNATASSL
jgi:DnaJ-class molecular chaperone